MQLQKPMTGISLDGVGRKFGSTVALEEISIEIPDGEFLVLLGPSGCGKSTLLRILAGLLAPTSGRVVIDGKDVTALPPGDRDIAMVFQSYALYPHLSVEKNLGFGLRVRHRSKEEIAAKVAAVAEQLQLSGLLTRKPKELSGGQRQRVALGRAVVRNPKAFLMDEPLSNLDAQLRTATRVELTELHRRLATTFVYVTHDQVEAMTMATRIAVMNHGHLEQIGTPAEVYDEPASTFVATFIGAPPMNLIPATARSVAGTVRLLADGVDVELARGELGPREVLIGVRPEHLTFAVEGGAGPRLAGVVVAMENLGSEEVAFCSIGDTQVALRGPRPLGVTPGERVTLTVAPERVYLFDPVTTRRLVWVDDEVDARDRSLSSASFA
jgi:multiple sugar transport system ATP-binding protein